MRAAIALCILCLGAVASCSLPRLRMIELQSLETAPPVALWSRRAMLQREPRAPMRQLAPDLWLVEVRTGAHWAALAEATTGLGPRPDLARGMVVGLLSRAGTPLDGDWPLELELARVHDGGGLISGSRLPGNYLPDGTGYLEAAYVPDCQAVLVVELNGARFYP